MMALGGFELFPDVRTTPGYLLRFGMACDWRWCRPKSSHVLRLDLGTYNEKLHVR